MYKGLMYEMCGYKVVNISRRIWRRCDDLGVEFGVYFNNYFVFHPYYSVFESPQNTEYSLVQKSLRCTNAKSSRRPLIFSCIGADSIYGMHLPGVHSRKSRLEDHFSDASVCCVIAGSCPDSRNMVM